MSSIIARVLDVTIAFTRTPRCHDPKLWLYPDALCCSKVPQANGQAPIEDAHPLVCLLALVNGPALSLLAAANEPVQRFPDLPSLPEREDVRLGLSFQPQCRTDIRIRQHLHHQQRLTAVTLLRQRQCGRAGLQPNRIDRDLG